MRIATLLSATIVTVLVAGATAEVVRYREAPKHAQVVALGAANMLGLNLATFAGPVRSGNHLLGTESFHWEHSLGGQPVERVAYLRQEQRLCWSVLEAQGWKDNGCIYTVPYEN